MNKTRNMIILRQTMLLGLTVALAFALGCQRPRPVPLAPAPAPSTQYQYKEQYVTAYRLNVRSGPSVKDTILAVLKRGEAVQVLGRSGSWIRVKRPPNQQYSGGFREGWVYGAYLTEYQDQIAPPSRPSDHNTPPQGWNYQQEPSMQAPPPPREQPSGFGETL